MNAIQRYLESLSSLHAASAPRGYRYASLFAFVLAEGIAFGTDNAIFPRTGTVKQCFANCFKMALRYPERYVYCEGYASGIIPLHHAWLWDKLEQRLVDPTWQDGHTYFGVPFCVQHITPAMLSTGSVIDDYHNRFPLLKEDADPKEYMASLEYMTPLVT